MSNIVRLKTDTPPPQPTGDRGHTGVCHGGPIDKATLAASGVWATMRDGAYRWANGAWHWEPLP